MSTSDRKPERKEEPLRSIMVRESVHQKFAAFVRDQDGKIGREAEKALITHIGLRK